MKLVVSTHVAGAGEPLRKLLWSLGGGEDVIVCVAGAGEGFDADAFAQSFEVRWVVSHESNNFEYTAFVALTEALWRRPELRAEHYVFLHDTVQAADEFWDILGGFTAEPGVVWYPFCDNFNMGIAAAEFVAEELYLAYRGVRLDKTAAIDIELDCSMPLSLRYLAGPGRWRYAFGEKMLVHAQRPWANDTDVYGVGSAPRCPIRLACGEDRPFLYKFTHLRDRAEGSECSYIWDFEQCLSELKN